MKNIDVRQYAAKKNVRLWQVAEKFGMCDSQFSRVLRKELPEKEVLKFRKYVDEIVIEQQREGRYDTAGKDSGYDGN